MDFEQWWEQNKDILFANKAMAKEYAQAAWQARGSMDSLKHAILLLERFEGLTQGSRIDKAMLSQLREDTMTFLLPYPPTYSDKWDKHTSIAGMLAEEQAESQAHINSIIDN
jgi:hypothetical protein